MEENMLKTSWKQRLIIALVAAVLLGSSLAVYVMIVLGNGNSASSSSSTDLSEIEAEYNKINEQYEARAAEVSKTYFDEFKSYKSNVKAFNAESVNSEGVTHTDLKEGSGETITSSSSNYAAYYIGFCANEEVFDSSFDDYENPTSLNAPLNIEPDYLIEGWYLGVDGMKIGGVREVAISGSLAYGDSYEICGGYSSPLKFIIMAVEKDSELAELNSKLEEVSNRYMEAYYSSLSTDEIGSDEEVIEADAEDIDFEE
ncbi:FKBP-type peptidyl-prolyl cis-trans isomerase [Candidatus Saccharibacteria bacterium]|nr:FKBP-type peptidyl-prolyl cis-trans isomerase [Candidatus Saccharibacteria bacterium]MBQ6605913.1 FKBP-type peptidyl-prolyl cis-trans isomerase [Candidatus Saccharibacteria bacterium]